MILLVAHDSPSGTKNVFLIARKMDNFVWIFRLLPERFFVKMNFLFRLPRYLAIFTDLNSKTIESISYYHVLTDLLSRIPISLATCISLNLFVSNVPFFYPLKASGNLTVFWYFQGVEMFSGGRERVHWERMG